MSKSGLLKIASFISFLVFILLGFILIAKVQPVFEVEGIKFSKGVFFILITLLFLCAILLFVISLNRPERKVIVEKITEKTEVSTKETDKDSESKVDTISSKEIEEIIKEISDIEETIKDVDQYTEKLLTNISKKFEIVQGVAYVFDQKEKIYQPKGKFAYFSDELPKEFGIGESIPGQVAKNKKATSIDDIPEGYIKIISGLGMGYPRHLHIFPIIFKDDCIGIFELATFKKMDASFMEVISKVADNIAVKINGFTKAKK